MKRGPAPEDPQSASAAYSTALRWLAARELSEGQVRARLRDRGFERSAVEGAVERLRSARILDDRRTAAALARTEAHVRRHGPRRILAKLASIHIDRDMAADVVRELFADVSEHELIERALDRRLRGGARDLTDARERRRVLGHLVRQGFSAAAAAAVLRRKSK